MCSASAAWVGPSIRLLFCEDNCFRARFIFSSRLARSQSRTTKLSSTSSWSSITYDSSKWCFPSPFAWHIGALQVQYTYIHTYIINVTFWCAIIYMTRSGNIFIIFFVLLLFLFLIFLFFNSARNPASLLIYIWYRTCLIFFVIFRHRDPFERTPRYLTSAKDI